MPLLCAACRSCSSLSLLSAAVAVVGCRVGVAVAVHASSYGRSLCSLAWLVVTLLAPLRHFTYSLRFFISPYVISPYLD